MRWHQVVLVSGLAAGLSLVVGCPSNGPERRGRAAVAAMRGFVDRMCECKDKLCADAVQDELARWSAEAQGDSIDDRSMKEMTEIVEAYGRCMATSLSFETPPPTERPPATRMHDADVLDHRRAARDRDPRAARR